MTSHIYAFSLKELARAVVPTLSTIAIGATLIHASHALHLLPERPMTLQPDETVLRHQAKASFSRHPAKIVLVGDSTCHAAVDAAALSSQLPNDTPVINLGLIIGIDLGSYAEAVRDFAAANPGQVRWVVLLICPARMGTGGDSSLWNQFKDEARHIRETKPLAWTLEDISGGRLLRERLASRVMPQPLSGKGAGLFGFTTGLDRYMDEHNGSIVDFGEIIPRSHASVDEMPIAEAFKIECGLFRERLPKDVRLAVGLTPGPISTSSAEARLRHLGYLERLSSLLEPDILLTNLPAALPAPCFSQSAHMNSLGQKLFTPELAKELSRIP